MVTMANASVSNLKANLSRHLPVVRYSDEVQVLDRGAPAAKLTPPDAVDGRDEEALHRRAVHRAG